MKRKISNMNFEDLDKDGKNNEGLTLFLKNYFILIRTFQLTQVAMPRGRH